MKYNTRMIEIWKQAFPLVVTEIGIPMYPKSALHLSQPTNVSERNTTRHRIASSIIARVPGYPRETPSLWSGCACLMGKRHRPEDIGPNFQQNMKHSSF